VCAERSVVGMLADISHLALGNRISAQRVYVQFICSKDPQEFSALCIHTYSTHWIIDPLYLPSNNYDQHLGDPLKRTNYEDDMRHFHISPPCAGAHVESLPLMKISL